VLTNVQKSLLAVAPVRRILLQSSVSAVVVVNLWSMMAKQANRRGVAYGFKSLYRFAVFHYISLYKLRYDNFNKDDDDDDDDETSGRILYRASTLFITSIDSITIGTADCRPIDLLTHSSTHDMLRYTSSSLSFTRPFTLFATC